jgi:L-asparaginase
MMLDSAVIQATMQRRKRIYVAHTGGTTGMQQGENGLQTCPGHLQRQMNALAVLRDERMPEYVIDEFDPLLDSSNMSQRDWVRIAQGVARHYDEFDGFVVLHGTDTMSYTASALAFMFENLRKPVILTGSQVPLCRPRNDAYENLVTSLLLAANFDLPEVTVFFNHLLLRGCRSVKSDSSSFTAFTSPNCPPLAVAGTDIEVKWHLIRPHFESTAPLRVQEEMDPFVGVLWLFPGITSEFVRNCLRPPLKGVVLKAFGAGNAPSIDRAFHEAVREATDRGVVIVACTQSLAGRVDLGSYATGSALAASGVISGLDMTTEAALTKLSYLFGKGLAAEDVKSQIGENLRGELT